MSTPNELEARNRQIEAELTALRRYALVLSADPDRAADLVQETVLRALSRWRQWRGDAPLRAWLFAIMRNNRFQDARRRARWRSVDLETADVAERAAAEAADPLLLRNVAAALAELNDEQREVVFLVAVEGMSYAETADLVGAPIGTVMSRLARARARLREQSERAPSGTSREGAR